jgi:hypothetical protein
MKYITYLILFKTLLHINNHKMYGFKRQYQSMYYLFSVI